MFPSGPPRSCDQSITPFSASLILCQPTLFRFSNIKYHPALPSPRRAESILPNSFVSTIMHVWHACTNSHIRTGRAEEIFERKQKQLALSETLFRSDFPVIAPIERSLCLVEVWFCHACFHSVQKSNQRLAGNITFFRLKRKPPGSGRNPTFLL